MVIAALLVFAALLIAWVIAPSEPAAPTLRAVPEDEAEALPVAA
jgi:hypothetical protein